VHRADVYSGQRVGNAQLAVVMRMDAQVTFQPSYRPGSLPELSFPLSRSRTSFQSCQALCSTSWFSASCFNALAG
jgi:hypothetical protein